MRLEAFTNPAGKLVPLLGGQRAFVPSPLPPTIDLAAIAMTMSDAMQAVGELKGACRRLPNPYFLISPLQRQEALTSSAMEGTFTTDDDLLLAEAGIKQDSQDATKEVINYINALNSSIKMLSSLPICHRVIKSAHKELLSGLHPDRGARKRPGEYKKEQNWIGGRTIDTARYVAPPPAETQQCMDQLESYLNRIDRSFPTPLIDLALIHYQIEAIHPFSDGNGRVGRMLISLMAMTTGLLDMPVLYISPVMEKYKDEYIDLMFNVSATSAWTEWLVFFFSRVADSCRQTVDTVDRLITLQETLRKNAGQAARSSSIIKLVDFFFERPAISISQAAERLQITYAAAKNSVEKLQSIGMLTVLLDTYPRLYYSPAIRRASRPV